MKFRTAWPLAFAVVICTAAAALATTMIPLSWQQLQEKSARVVLVQATSRTVEQVGNVPTTLVTCRVLKTFHGDHRASVVLRVPGGKSGDLTMKVPGAPIPEVGDTFVAFLRPDGGTHAGRAVMQPVGMGQGMFELVQRDGRRYLVQTLGGAPQRFAECSQSTPECLQQFDVLIEAFDDFPARLAAREQ